MTDAWMIAIGVGVYVVGWIAAVNTMAADDYDDIDDPDEAAAILLLALLWPFITPYFVWWLITLPARVRAHIKRRAR